MFPERSAGVMTASARTRRRFRNMKQICCVVSSRPPPRPHTQQFKFPDKNLPSVVARMVSRPFVTRSGLITLNFDDLIKCLEIRSSLGHVSRATSGRGWTEFVLPLSNGLTGQFAGLCKKNLAKFSPKFSDVSSVGLIGCALADQVSGQK